MNLPKINSHLSDIIGNISKSVLTTLMGHIKWYIIYSIWYTVNVLILVYIHRCSLNYIIYRGYLEMPQKTCEGGILHVKAYAIFPEMPQNRTYSFSVLFSFSNRSRAFFSKCPTFFCSFFLKCPIFPIWFWKWEKWGISGKTNIKKWGISRKKHAIDLKTRKTPKLNMFDFGAFQEKNAYAITCKICPTHNF